MRGAANPILEDDDHGLTCSIVYRTLAHYPSWSAGSADCGHALHRYYAAWWTETFGTVKVVIQSGPEEFALPTTTFRAFWSGVMILLSAGIGSATLSPTRATTSGEIELNLKKLAVTGSVLYLAAHPDDENTALLAYLANERLVRTGYLSLTRGDGGQNLIGSEKGAILGVIRTEELLAARAIDGAEQFFSRAIDFGYSKSSEETIAIWGREEILEDIVRVYRSFRPDVIITRFPGDGGGGHGHHTASAILAREAMDLASDAYWHPELGDPWQVRRLFWNWWTWGEGPTEEELDSLVAVDVGGYNTYLGKSYTEIAAVSRTMHKSQGFGSAGSRGTRMNYLKLQRGEPAQQDFLDGVDLTWGRIQGGERVGELLQEAAERFRSDDPSATIPQLLEVGKELARLIESGDGRGWSAGNALLPATLTKLNELMRACAGQWVEVIADRHTITPGTEVKLTATVVNRLGQSAGSPAGNRNAKLFGMETDEIVDVKSGLNESMVKEFTFTLPADMNPGSTTQPEWLRSPPSKGRFVNAARSVGSGARAELFIPPAISIVDPILFRSVDRVKGELYRPLRVVPAVTLDLGQKIYLYPDSATRDIKISITAHEPIEGVLSLILPPGWRADPAAVSLRFDETGSEQIIRFAVTPPPNDPDDGTISARFTSNGRLFDESMITIDYDHIPIRTILQHAEARIVRLSIKREGDYIGYVTGSGDEVPEALRAVGYDVTELDNETLRSGNLTGYDAIVFGIRAFNINSELPRYQERVLEYVNGGGTVVVQYNTAGRRSSLPAMGPFPFELGRGRVTVEEAEMTFLDSTDPILSGPNRITSADFDGWVQERGLYFASEWDAGYRTVLACHDPGEDDLEGGLLVGEHGKGVFIYTGFSFFRQLPAGVPGAYRLFVNLVSARTGSQSP